MTEDQQATINQVMSDLNQQVPGGAHGEGQPVPGAPAEPAPVADTQQVSQETASPAPSAAPSEAATEPGDQSDNEVNKGAAQIYQEKLQKLMSTRRDERQQQLQQQQQAEYIAKMRRIEEAKQYGPEAVLKAAGLDAPAQSKQPTLAELLGGDDDDRPDYVKQMEAKLNQQQEFIDQFQGKWESYQNNQQQQAQSAWEHQELSNIGQFIQESNDKFPYLGALKSLNAEQDLYNGMINMYNQGYQPTYEEMGDLLETRVESLLDTIADSGKFKQWVGKRFGVQISTPSKASESPTLTGQLGAESPGSVDPATLSDEESMKLALKAAYAEAERIKGQ